MGSSQFIGANTATGTFVGTRTLQPTPGAVTWVSLNGNTGYPMNVCGITLASMGNTLYVKVITTGGSLFETTCSITGGTLSCPNDWSPLTPNPALLAAMRHTNRKGDVPLP